MPNVLILQNVYRWLIICMGGMKFIMPSHVVLFRFCRTVQLFSTTLLCKFKIDIDHLSNYFWQLNLRKMRGLMVSDMLCENVVEIWLLWRHSWCYFCTQNLSFLSAFSKEGIVREYQPNDHNFFATVYTVGLFWTREWFMKLFIKKMNPYYKSNLFLLVLFFRTIYWNI